MTAAHRLRGSRDEDYCLDCSWTNALSPDHHPSPPSLLARLWTWLGGDSDPDDYPDYLRWQR